MTTLLQQAFERASKLPPDEQDVLASRVLAEVSSEEDEFDRRIAATSHRLVGMARAAFAEHRDGRTMALDPGRL